MEAEKCNEDIRNYLKESVEKARKAALDVDTKIKENPWPTIAGVAAISLLVGYLMARSRKN